MQRQQKTSILRKKCCSVFLVFVVHPKCSRIYIYIYTYTYIKQYKVCGCPILRMMSSITSPLPRGLKRLHHLQHHTTAPSSCGVPCLCQRIARGGGVVEPSPDWVGGDLTPSPTGDIIKHRGHIKFIECHIIILVHIRWYGQGHMEFIECHNIIISYV